MNMFMLIIATCLCVSPSLSRPDTHELRAVELQPREESETVEADAHLEAEAYASESNVEAVVVKRDVGERKDLDTKGKEAKDAAKNAIDLIRDPYTYKLINIISAYKVRKDEKSLWVYHLTVVVDRCKDKVCRKATCDLVYTPLRGGGTVTYRCVYN